MTSQKKLEEVKKLKELLLKYKVIAVGDLTSLPSKQFQTIRSKLKPGVEVRVSKKALIKRAISELKEKDLKGLEKYVEKVMPVLLFTNDDPFKLYKDLKKSKSKAAAKPGQVSPNDIEVKAGPTDFPPGPIIGELGQVGIVASVEEGKIAIKKDSTLVKEGEIISNKVSSILAKLGIEPMEIGLNLKVVYDNGTIYEKSILDFDEEKLVNDIKLAHQQAINLSVKIEHFSKETTKILISKGYMNAKALSSKVGLDVKEEKKEEPKLEETSREENKREPKKEETVKEKPKEDKELNLKKSTYEEDSKKAEEVLTKLKDEGEIKKAKPKEEKPSSIKPEDLVDDN